MQQKKTLAELIEMVELCLKQVSTNGKGLVDAQRALNAAEVDLHNAQTELGKALDVAGVVGSDFRLVNRQTASRHVLQHVFGIVHEVG